MSSNAVGFIISQSIAIKLKLLKQLLLSKNNLSRRGKGRTSLVSLIKAQGVVLLDPEKGNVVLEPGRERGGVRRSTVEADTITKTIGLSQ